MSTILLKAIKRALNHCNTSVFQSNYLKKFTFIQNFTKKMVVGVCTVICKGRTTFCNFGACKHILQFGIKHFLFLLVVQKCLRIGYHDLPGLILFSKTCILIHDFTSAYFISPSSILFSQSNKNGWSFWISYVHMLHFVAVTPNYVISTVKGYM